MQEQRSRSQMIRFDEEVAPKSALDDLDEALVARFRTGQTRDDFPTLVRKLGMAQEYESGTLRPTVAGILMGTRRPEEFMHNAKIQAVSYRGKTVASEMRKELYQLDAEEITGPLDAQIARACQFVQRNQKVAASKRAGRTDYPQYDATAIFEAVVNAVAHRDYSMALSKIRLRMFSDRLEIYSPGAIANTMTVDMLAHRQASRNETITSLLAKCKIPEEVGELETSRTSMMDRRGEGVAQILERSEKLSGKLPVYEMLGEDELRLTIFSFLVENEEA